MTDLPNSSVPTHRRGFLARLLGGAAALSTLGAAPASLLAAGTRDDDWMSQLTGTHRTVFDVSSLYEGKVLRQAKNFLDAWRDAYKTPESDVNLVIGVHGDAIPLVMTDALWARFKLGEQYKVTDASTKSAAAQNVFASEHAVAGGLIPLVQSVESLQKRGVRFLVCRNTIGSASVKFAAAGFGNADEIRQALLGGIMPGVIPVPAMVVALTQLQERGLRYTKIA